jgi:hypothetical protein
MRYLLFIIFTLICVTGFGQTIPNPVFKGNVASTSLDAGNVYNIDITLISDATGIYNGTSVDDDGSWVVWKDCQRYVISTKTFAFATQFIGKVTDIHTNGAPALGLNAAVIKENSFGYASFVGGIPDGSQQCISQYYADILANQTSTASGDAIEIVVPHANAVNVGQLVTTNGSYSYVPADTSFAIATHGVVVSRTTGYATVVTEGKAYVPGHLLTLHVPLYVSDTPGEFTTTQYDENVQPIAIAFDTDSILVTSKMMLGGGFGGGGTPLADADQTLAAPRTITGTSTNTLTFDSGTADGTPDVIFNDAITIQGNTKISSGTNPLGTSVIIGANTAPNLNSANNVIIGDSAFFNVAGGATVPDNVIIGGSAGVENTVGRYLTLVGAWAGQKNRTGLDNTGVGQLALQYNDDGNFYTAFGYGAGRRARIDSTGGLGLSAENVFLGWAAGHGPLTGPYNSGRRNLFVGYQAGFYHETGDDNTLIGFRSGENGNGNNWNVALGGRSLLDLTSGDNNTSIGALAGENTSIGIRNTYLGYAAGNNVVDGSDNIILGANMNASATSASNEFIAGFNGTDFLSYNKAASGEWIMQGGIELPSYAAGAKDGTAVKTFGLDASNKLVTFTASSSGLYAGSGALSGATTVTQAANNLTFATTGDANSLVINGTDGTVGFGTTSSNSTFSAIFGKHAGFADNTARFSWFDSSIIGMETDGANRLISGENASGGYWIRAPNMGVNRLPDAGGATFVTQGTNEFYTTGTANRTVFIGTFDSPNVANEGLNIEVDTLGQNSHIREGGQISEFTLAAGIDGNQNDTYIKLTSGDNTTGTGGVTILGGQPNSDIAPSNTSITASSANQTATTNMTGANVIINGGAKATAGATTLNGNVILANLRGSVGIGTATPDAASTLDVVSTSQGSRPVPNMTEAQRDVINGGTFVEGLQVYNTDTKKFNYWDGTAWVVSGDETTWKLSGGGAPTTTTEDVYREGKVSVGSVFWNEGLMNINKLAADTVGLMFNTPDILLEDVLMRVRTPTNYREVELAYQSNENSLMFGNPLAALTYGNAKINALVSMTTGGSGEKLTNPFASVLMGYSVLPYATSSNSTTAIGYQTGFNLTSGNNNVLMGTDAGFNWTTVSNSIAIGRHPFFEGTSSTNFVGNYVTVLGNDGFGAATSGSNFGGFGHLQATAATSINQSYLIGDDVFRYRPTISSSTVAGYQAGLSDASGSTAPIETTIFGYRSKYNTDDISYSTSVGSSSGFISGAYNAAYDQVGTAYFGYQAGYNTYGSNSHFFGYRAGAQGSPTSVSNAVAIGYRAGDGQIGDNELYIANSNTATPLIGGNFSTAIAEIGGTLEVLTMATDNANSNVVVRNATTGALELNTSIGGNIYSADGTIPAASDRTATLADDLYFVPTVSEGLAIGVAPGTDLNATFDIQSGSDEAIFTNAASAGNSVVHFNNGPGAVAEMRNFGDGNALTLQTEEGSAISASTAQTVNTNSAAIITKITDDATGKNLVITERALSSATVTDGFGMYNQSILEDAANSALAAGYDEVTWTDATNGVAKRIIGVRGDGIAASGSGIALQGAGTDGYVQVGINSITPDASAALDVVSTTTGFLPPRMTTTQRDAISSPATGLQVYNTTTNQNNIYNGTSWVAVVTDADSYTHTFLAAAWGGTSGAYTQTITAATHGLGTDINNHNIYSDDGTSYISEVSTEVSINKTTGDVTLTSSSPTTFDGKVTFKK